jgi:putative Mn2+ efflux pump MntP
MCILALILGIFGTIMALIGMILSLIRVYNTEPLLTFVILIFITIFVLIGAGVGIYGIVRIIKRNPEILER